MADVSCGDHVFLQSNSDSVAFLVEAEEEEA